MASSAQQLRDTIAKTVAIGAAVSGEAAAIKAEASQAAQGNAGKERVDGGRPSRDRA
jgi:hypothetical protein